MERTCDASGRPKPAVETEIVGYLFGIQAEDGPTVVPCLLLIEGVKVLAIFSTPEKLEACYRAAGITPLKIKQVDHAGEFIESIPYPIIIDPWTTPEGNTRGLVVQ